MMTITYPVYNGIYVNMTNRCPCACTFCLRHLSDHVEGSDSLWLDREPTVKEVCDSIDTWDLTKYSEIVFCGYGEPTERLNDLLEVAKYIRYPTLGNRNFALDGLPFIDDVYLRSRRVVR